MKRLSPFSAPEGQDLNSPGRKPRVGVPIQPESPGGPTFVCGRAGRPSGACGVTFGARTRGSRPGLFKSYPFGVGNPGESGVDTAEPEVVA